MLDDFFPPLLKRVPFIFITGYYSPFQQHLQVTGIEYEELSRTLVLFRFWDSCQSSVMFIL